MNTYIKIFITIVLLFPVSVFSMTAVVSVDTNREEINALEGTLVLPEGMQISRIETGNSVILMWINEPQQNGREISFAGITPGGFFGAQPLFVLSGTFYPKDLEKVRFESVRALKNDGTGERTPVILALSMVAFRADSDSPEVFVPVVANDPSVFDGRNFLVFTTQDKGSGIKSYEVREGRFSQWKEAESPYLLTHQDLNRNIYVKAVDYAGNERVSVVPVVHSLWWSILRFFVILMILVFVWVVYKKEWVHFIK